MQPNVDVHLGWRCVLAMLYGTSAVGPRILMALRKIIFLASIVEAHKTITDFMCVMTRAHR